MKYIIGKKLDMTQVWRNKEVVAVTRVKAEPCTVVQIKSEANDGYAAVQLGYGERKKKNINKPQLGHMKKLGSFAKLREFRAEAGELKLGDKIDVSTFESGDNIEVTGITKGKGFQGVVKRYGFKGQKATHGNKDQLRMPGSIGATGPAHVFKGQKMPGRMGGDQLTIKNLEIVEVDTENNILLIRGAVPGARNGLILVRGEGELKIQTSAANNKIVDKSVETKHALSKTVKEAPADKTEKTEKKPVETHRDASKAAKEEKTKEKPASKEEEIKKVEKEVEKAKEKVDEKKDLPAQTGEKK